MTKLDRSFILSVLRNNDQLLAPAQHKICLPILNRIYKKMIYDLKFDDMKVYENLIIDGHHRYLASILSEVPLYHIKLCRQKLSLQLSITGKRMLTLSKKNGIPKKRF